jgi:solute carrier family 8 (sodium/calcium exchanger)
MVLGSSAPEILLSVIEIIGERFEAGHLGPGTIVGAAAFNLFVITGICNYVIPNGEVRKIEHAFVYATTSTWCVFAYIWLYIILGVTSPGVHFTYKHFTFMEFSSVISPFISQFHHCNDANYYDFKM